MKNLTKIALGAVVVVALAGCNESAKFGDKEYTSTYLRDNPNVKKELISFCKENKNAKLTTIQMKNCKLASFEEQRDAQDEWTPGRR